MSNTARSATGQVGFTVGRDELAAALAYVVGGIPSRPSVPILGGVLLTAEADGTVVVATFDYEQARTVTLDGTAVTSPGRMLVGCKALHEIVKKLPTGKKGTKTRPAVPAPTIAFAESGSRLTLHVGTAQFGLDTMPTEDYPELPKLPATVGTIDGAKFASAAARVATSAGKDDTLPVLTGVYFVGTAHSAMLDATDRYRLGAADLGWSPADADMTEPVKALISAKTLTGAAKVFGKAGRVDIGRGGNPGAYEGTLSLSWGDGAWTLWTRTLDGDFPKVRKLFPDKYGATALVDRATLIAKVELIATTLDRAMPVRLILDGDTLTVRGGGDNSESAGSESMPAQIRAAERLVVAFNPTYLIAGLKAAGTERVHLGFCESGGNCKRPAVIYPTDADGQVTGDFRYLIMPVRIEDGVDAPKPAEPPADPAAVEAIEKREAQRAADAEKIAEKVTPVRKERTRKVVAAAVAASAEPAPVEAEPAPAEPEAEPVEAEGTTPEGESVTEVDADAKVVRIVRTVEHGTIAFGTDYGDGSMDVIGRGGLKWGWSKYGQHFYLGDRDADTFDPAPALLAAERMREAGFTVAAELDGVMPAEQVKAAKAEAKRAAIARKNAEPTAEVVRVFQPADVKTTTVKVTAVKPADLDGVKLAAPTRAADGGWVWATFATAEDANLKETARDVRVLIQHGITNPANDGADGAADQLRLSVYRDNGAKRLLVTAYPPASGRELDVAALRAAIVSTTLGVRGVTASV